MILLNLFRIEKCWSVLVTVGGRWEFLITLSQPHVSFPPSYIFPLQHHSHLRERKGSKLALNPHSTLHWAHVYTVGFTVRLLYIFWQLNRNSCSLKAGSDVRICFPENICETASRLPGLLSLSPVSLDFPASQAGGNLESRTNHSLPIFVQCPELTVQIVLSLVKMFGNVSPHCPGFVTLPRS